MPITTTTDHGLTRQMILDEPAGDRLDAWALLHTLGATMEAYVTDSRTRYLHLQLPEWRHPSMVGAQDPDGNYYLWEAHPSRRHKWAFKLIAAMERLGFWVKLVGLYDPQAQHLPGAGKWWAAFQEHGSSDTRPAFQAPGEDECLAITRAAVLAALQLVS